MQRLEEQKGQKVISHFIRTWKKRKNNKIFSMICVAEEQSRLISVYLYPPLPVDWGICKRHTESEFSSFLRPKAPRQRVEETVEAASGLSHFLDFKIYISTPYLCCVSSLCLTPHPTMTPIMVMAHAAMWPKHNETNIKESEQIWHIHMFSSGCWASYLESNPNMKDVLVPRWIKSTLFLVSIC